MNWIKKNPAPFALALVSLGTLALGSMLYSKVAAFPDNFSTSIPTERNTVEPADLATVDAALKSAVDPVAWKPKDGSGLLFVSRKYIEKPPILLDPTSGGTPLHPPVPNIWLLNNKLDITSSTVLTDDPDADGFSNLEEFNGMDTKPHLTTADGTPTGSLLADSTDPNDPKSHPAHLTKLILSGIQKVPFRLVLKSYDGNPENKAAMTFFVNTVDRGRRTELLKIGDTIPSDPRYKLTDFVSRMDKGADETETDNSELIIVNTAYTDEKPLSLPLNKEVDSPESYAIFKYLWVEPGGKTMPDFPVKKNGEFTLQPEPEKKYKLLKFGEGMVEIQLPSGDKVTVPLSK